MAMCRTILSMLILLGAGCGSKSGHERFLPSEEVARNALEQMLEQWQKGEIPTSMAREGLPAITPVDSHRRPGQKLLHYEILGEVSGGGPKCFVVRVALDQPREEQKIRYVVLGQDPLWVVRQEDFVMLEQWSHPMSKDDARSGSKKQ